MSSDTKFNRRLGKILTQFDLVKEEALTEALEKVTKDRSLTEVLIEGGRDRRLVDIQLRRVPP